MPYEVTAPEVTVLRDLSIFRDEKGDIIGYDRDAVLHVLGDVIPDNEVAQVVKDAYEAGDPHVTSILSYTSGTADPAADDFEHDVNQDLNLSDPEDPVPPNKFAEPINDPGVSADQPWTREDTDNAPFEVDKTEPNPDDLANHGQDNRIPAPEVNDKSAEAVYSDDNTIAVAENDKPKADVVEVDAEKPKAEDEFVVDGANKEKVIDKETDTVEVTDKTKKTRRTKAQIEADKAAETKTDK